MGTSVGGTLCSVWRFMVSHFRRIALTYFFPHVEKRCFRIYGYMNSPRVIRLTKHTVFKRAFVGSLEAETMRLVSQHTSIPVPQVLDDWFMTLNGHVYEGIVMEWVPGNTLETAWPSLNDDQKSRIAEQLKGYVSELRSLTQPKHLSGRICSLNGGPFCDPLLLGHPCGPFNSEQEFNEFCLSRLAKFSWEPSTRAQIETVRNNLTDNHRIMFTHSDLTPRNILVDGQNNIVSILDWEMAGWKPEQWEYLKTMWMGQYDEGWPTFVHRILPDYHDQLDLHNEMCGMHGAPF